MLLMTIVGPALFQDTAQRCGPAGRGAAAAPDEISVRGFWGQAMSELEGAAGVEEVAAGADGAAAERADSRLRASGNAKSARNTVRLCIRIFYIFPPLIGFALRTTKA
jgi:hypothetical protein